MASRGTRKRVSRAGRGAHAIYLPKAWIDAWSPAQRETMEIDLRAFGDHLVLSPVHGNRTPTARLDSRDPDDLCRLLLSAYLSGHHSYSVHAPRGFTDAQLIEARRFLRLLDERLEVHWDEHHVRFHRDPQDVSPATLPSLLRDLGTKVHEATEGVTELLEFFPHNPQRVLHAAHLITTIERDDIQRLKNQAYRRVARLQLAVEHIPDLQLLMVAAHTFARMGKLLVEIAATLTDQYGLPRTRLHHPPELLEDLLPRNVAAPGPVFRGFVEQSRHDLEAYHHLLDAIRTLTTQPRLSGREGLQISRDAAASHDKVMGNLMARVQAAWGPSFVDEDPAAIYRVVKVHVHVQDLIEQARVLADRIADFRMARDTGV